MFLSLLQWWGGVFYLLHKVFSSLKERTSGKRRSFCNLALWVVYLIGLPAWVTYFFLYDNYIAATVELGGAPAMALGLILAWRAYRSGGIEQKQPLWLVAVALSSTVYGLWYSVNAFGGLTTLNQTLELLLSVGYLLGTYLQSKDKATCYLAYLLMNGSNAWLMGVQGSWLLMVQQIISIGFIADAYYRWKKRHT